MPNRPLREWHFRTIRDFTFRFVPGRCAALPAKFFTTEGTGFHRVNLKGAPPCPL